MCDLLFVYSSPHQMHKETCFIQMGFALRAILDIIIKEKGIGMRELYCVMQASHVFYHIQEKDNRKVCLTTEVDQHRIF